MDIFLCWWDLFSFLDVGCSSVSQHRVTSDVLLSFLSPGFLMGYKGMTPPISLRLWGWCEAKVEQYVWKYIVLGTIHGLCAFMRIYWIINSVKRRTTSILFFAVSQAPSEMSGTSSAVLHSFREYHLCSFSVNGGVQELSSIVVCPGTEQFSKYLMNKLINLEYR